MNISRLEKRVQKKRKKAERADFKKEIRAQLGRRRAFLNISGNLSALAYRFSLNLFLTLDIFIAALSLFGIVFNYLAKSDAGAYFTAAFAISVFIPIVNQTIKWVQLKKEVGLFFELANEHTAQTKSLPLPDKYVQSGYQYYDYTMAEGDTKRYIMSHKINELVNLVDLDLYYDKTRFSVPQELRKYVPFAFRHVLNGDAKIFNGKCLKQISDIYIDTKDFYTQKTDYFTHLATNGMVYKKISNNGKINEIFYGNVLVETEIEKDGKKTKQLRNLETSRCANILGINTIAVTKDGYLIVSKQGSKSFENPGNYAPSGSGSAQCKRLRPKQSLKSFLTKEMERELKEEVNLKSKTPMLTDVIGYARFVENGGKADFFGATYIDQNYEGNDKNCIKYRLLVSKERIQNLMGDAQVEKLKDLSMDSVLEALEDYCAYPKKDETKRSAFQLDITKNALEGFKKSGREIFLELREKLEKQRQNKTICFCAKGQSKANDETANFNNGFYWLLDGASNYYAKSDAQLIARWNHHMLAQTQNDKLSLEEVVSAVHQRVSEEYSPQKNVPQISAAFAKHKDGQTQIIVYGSIKVCIKTNTQIITSQNTQYEKAEAQIIQRIKQISQQKNISIGQARLTKEAREHFQLVKAADFIVPKGALPQAESFKFDEFLVESIIMMTDGFYAYGSLGDNYCNVFSVLKNHRKIANYYKNLKSKLMLDITCDKYPRIKQLDTATVIRIDS